MMERRCDVAIIGAGSAGLAAREAAAEEGADVVLIEKGPGGTTCARVGCMPSKLLIAAANTMHTVSDAGRFGVIASEPKADSDAVLSRLRRHRDRFVDIVRKNVAALPPGSIIAGHARFDGPTQLRIDGNEDVTALQARTIVIATGSQPEIPTVLDPVGDRVLTTDTLFEIGELPSSIAVLGAGPVGLELAQALARLGVRTVLIDPTDRIGGLSDPKVSDAARRALADEFELLLGVNVTAAVRDGDGVRLTYSSENGASEDISVLYVLAATGRPPALDGLLLKNAGIELDDHGTPIFDPASRQCSGSSPVFIAGDAGHDRPILHEARRSGKIAGRNAAKFPDVERPSRWTSLAVVYSHPGIAVVGDGYDEKALSDGVLQIGCADYSDQGRAVVDGVASGLLRIYADRSGRIRGAEMACPDAEHIGHLLAWGIQEGWTAQQMLDRPFYHPATEEGLRTALTSLTS